MLLVLCEKFNCI